MAQRKKQIKKLNPVPQNIEHTGNKMHAYFITIGIGLIILVGALYLISKLSDNNESKGSQSMGTGENLATTDPIYGNASANTSTKKEAPKLNKVDETIPDAVYCDTDADCEPVFSTCSCEYSCVNGLQYQAGNHVTCNTVCSDTDLQKTIQCGCQNHKCTETF